jgi:hypothetical protein
MTALARTSSNCKRQTPPLVREDYDCKGSVKKKKKIKMYDRESQGAWRQDELIDGKPPFVR